MARYPKEMPVLTAADFARGKYYTGGQSSRKCKCLAGWLFDVFGVKQSDNPVYDRGYLRRMREVPVRARCALAEAINEEAGFKAISFRNMWIPTGIEDYNDHGADDRRVLARVWNRFTLKLGYEVGNPEAEFSGSRQ